MDLTAIVALSILGTFSLFSIAVALSDPLPRDTTSRRRWWLEHLPRDSDDEQVGR